MILVDRAENVWIRGFAKPGDSDVTWLAFDRDGESIGRIRLGRSTELLEAGSHYLLVVEKDEFDVETVRLLDLVR